MKKSNVSIIIFSTNSENVLERALKSCSFADEVIVVDTSSHDNSVKIAKKYTKKVYTVPFTPYIEPIRQQALLYATHEWVFFLDADEELPITMQPVLEQIMTMKVAAARVPRKNMIFGKWMEHTGYWPDYNIRFFNKNNITWHSEIHSNPTVAGEMYDIPIEERNAIIHHHYTSISEYIEKMNRYTTIQAAETNNVFAWQNLFAHPTGEFVKRFFYWEGYLDGVHGLAISFLSSIYVVVVELKKWELQKFLEPRESLELTDIVNELKKTKKEFGYWIAHILIKDTKNIPKKLLLKLHQKLQTK